MEGWRAGLMGFGIVLIGLGGYSSLDGVWKGLSLVAAGIALVLLGLSLERKPRAAAAAAGDAEGEASAVDDQDVTVPMAAVAVEEAEPTVPIALTGSDAAEARAPEPELVAGVETSEAPEVEAAPAVDEAEPVDEPALDVSEEAAPRAAAVDETEDVADDDTAHFHDQPMLGHSELVSHIRDYHESVPFDGSTIQLRLLHERAHA